MLMSATLHGRFDAEIDFVGDFMFGNGISNDDPNSNRHMLIELCSKLDLQIANTYFSHDVSQQITYFDLHASPNSDMTPLNFAQIDFVLIDRLWMYSIKDVWSDHHLPLQSHHFPVICDLEVEVPKQWKKNRKKSHDIEMLKDEKIARNFASCFVNRFQILHELQDGAYDDVDSANQLINDAI